MSPLKPGGLWQRLRRLDERSGAADYVHSRAEFFAPVHLLASVVLTVVIVVSIVAGNLPFVAFGVVALLLEGTRAYVGFRDRRARNRSEDQWRDPW